MAPSSVDTATLSLTITTTNHYINITGRRVDFIPITSYRRPRPVQKSPRTLLFLQKVKLDFGFASSPGHRASLLENSNYFLLVKTASVQLLTSTIAQGSQSYIAIVVVCSVPNTCRPAEPSRNRLASSEAYWLKLAGPTHDFSGVWSDIGVCRAIKEGHNRPQCRNLGISTYVISVSHAGLKRLCQISCEL